MILPPQKLQCRSSHAAAALRLLLLLGTALAMESGTARASPCCNLLHGVNLAPCLAMAAASGGAAAGVVNISAACCSSLNEALDAGRRCLCSLLLSNGVLAGLVATLIPTLPMVLPLPGCYLYSPPLTACQATLMQTSYDASPASASSAAARAGGAAGGGAVDPPPPLAAVAPSPKNGSAVGTKEGGRTDGSTGNGSREGRSVRRSDACRQPSVGEGTSRTYMLIFVVAMAVFWFD